MVRNLMLILGVSLSLAAFGCSSDGGTGGTGGGGTGGDGGTTGGGGETGGGGSNGLPSDACTNDDDLAIVCDAGFSGEVGICATDERGDPVATAACLVRDTGVSAACASCYGAVTGCVLANCVGECAAAPDSQACTDCQIENGCDVLQDNCTGDLESACPSGGGGAGGDGGGGAGGAS